MVFDEIKDIASQCFGCSNPHCSKGCPLEMEIPTILKYVKEDNLEEAYKKILEKSYFGSVCGRVCSHERQCQGECVRGVSSEPVQIGEVEKFVCDWGMKNYKESFDEITLEKVAVVGSGPAGLTCAIELRKKGYDVTVFEREKTLGGILRKGIPEYRLSNDIVDKVVENILQYGINIKTEAEFGKDFTIEDLKNDGFKAVFLGLGNDMPKQLKIPGADLKGVYWANDFIKNVDSIEFENVVVVGGGNVAMDACRIAKRKGAQNVIDVYRKTKDKMKASDKEIIGAKEDGVRFIFEALPVEIIGDEKVEKVILDNGKEIDADTFIFAIGALPNYAILPDEIKYSDDSLVKVNDNGETSVGDIFAGGDLVEKKSTVCAAVKTAKIAANGIDNKLRNSKE